MRATTIEEHILSIVCSVFEAYSAVLFLPEDDKEVCTIRASFSLGPKLNHKAEPMAATRTAERNVTTKRRPCRKGEGVTKETPNNEARGDEGATCAR